MDLVSPIALELDHRMDLWRQVLELGGPDGLKPSDVNQDGLGLVKGQRGVFRDAGRTVPISPETHGVTVGVMHRGDRYPDDLYDDGIIYHYPRGKTLTTDVREIAATKAAGSLGLPVFVVISNKARRDVRLGWVEDWDDGSELFSIQFGETPPAPRPTTIQEAPFEPFEAPAGRTSSARIARPNQRRFAFDVFTRYGTRCAFCSISHRDLVVAAHIIEKHENGSDDARNGLALCPTHHAAFDKGLLRIDPTTLDVVPVPEATLEALGVTTDNLRHLTKPPHPDALMHHWAKHKPKK